MLRLVTAAAVLALTAPALAQVPGSSPTVSAQQPGKSSSCINRRLIRSIDPDGPGRLRFRMQVGVDYRSPLVAACHFTPGAQQFLVRSNGGSFDLCEGDTLDIVSGQSGSAFDSCQVGAFTAVPKDHP